MKLSVDQAIRKAATLAAKGQKAEAATIYRDVLQRFPANKRALDGIRELEPPVPDANALLNRGNALQQERRFEEAIAAYDLALRLKPDFMEAHNNRGNALKSLGRLEEALAAYDMVIRLAPDLAIAHFNRGFTLKDMHRLEESIASYDEAIRLKPDLAEAHLNRGNVLRSLKSLEAAIASYDRALRIRPDYADVHSNRGFALQELGLLDEAVAAYDRAIRLSPGSVGAYNNRGSALQEMQRPVEAIESYAMALRLKPDFGGALVQMLHQKALICDWDISAEAIDFRSLDAAGVAIPPTHMLALRDDPALHLDLARAWANSQATLSAPAVLKAAPQSGKLRIGYFSADYYDHATMFLMARLFELHDKDQFEIHAFSYGPDRQDGMRRRLVEAVDHFHDVRTMSDPDVAQLARRSGIDVAVDLKGYTLGTRSSIFAYRAAPVQISYLGYPGSMGADFIDYIIADGVLVPPESRQFYSEKVIYLPHSYQVNDDQRLVPTGVCERSAFGLPAEGFVFCCFNNNYKIHAPEFDIWMRLLRQVEGSVLWLFEANEWAKANLRKEAAVRGVDPDRLVFAPKVSQGEHLARHACADLFLDTFNYNAHTTTSDALWSGLPIVTRAGKSFAARVAASLLGAIGLPELVTETEADYQGLALGLATDPARLLAIKAKLAANRLTAPLFDSRRFARDIEAAYVLAYRRAQNGLLPDHIQVPAS